MYKSCFFKHCSSYVETCTLVEFQHWTLLKLQHALRLIIMFYTFSLPPHLIVPCVGRTGFGCAYMPFGSGGSIIQMLTQHLARFKAHVHDQYIKNEVQGLVHSTKRAFLVITTITVLHDFNKKNDSTVHLPFTKPPRTRQEALFKRIIAIVQVVWRRQEGKRYWLSLFRF